MRLASSIVLVLPLLATSCFDPSTGRLDSTATPSSTTTDAPLTTSSDDDSTGPAVTSTTAAPDDTSGGTSEGGTTVALDGTSTGSTGEVTTASTTALGSTDDGSTTSGSSSDGAMACTPGPVEVEFVSLGDFINQGDAWQSFTANTDGNVVQIDFYWNLSGTNDAFTINLYEGEGTAGPLLHSQGFPGQGVGTFVGFDAINVLSMPVPIVAGGVYTVQGVDTFGWQTASGAIAGGNSSLGVGQHKNIQVWIEPCS